MALDRFGRRIHYLRISLTDHCNLRCVYCMPEDMTFRPPAEMLQDEEIIFLVRLFASLGFDKIRLTGGEPTVRAHVVDLVREIAATPGIKSLTMTTNGVLLGKLARPLKAAGLQRVNISLDTLDPVRFHQITRWGNLRQVWEGILAAEEAGLTPIKINAVVVRGYNEADIVDLARLTLEHDWQVRFIDENMKQATDADFEWADAVFVSGMHIQRHAQAHQHAHARAAAAQFDQREVVAIHLHAQGQVGLTPAPLRAQLAQRLPQRLIDHIAHRTRVRQALSATPYICGKI